MGQSSSINFKALEREDGDEIVGAFLLRYRAEPDKTKPLVAKLADSTRFLVTLRTEGVRLGTWLDR